MKRLARLASLLLLTGALAGPNGDSIEPGLWETTVNFTSVEMGGDADVARSFAEQVQGQPSVASRCVTPEEAANPTRDIVHPSGASGCVLSEALFAEGRIRLRNTCPNPSGEGQLRVSLIGAYTPTRMDGALNTELTGAGAVRMSGTLTSRRLGPCPSEGEDGSPGER